MNRISIELSIARVVLSLGSVLLAAGTLGAQSPHQDFSGFWEPKYTGGSGAFSDVFGKVDRAPLVPGLPPMQRPSGEHPAYGAKDPVDGSACRVLAFPFFMTSSPPFDILQRDDEILIVSEREGGSRHIYMDGRSHPSDVEHTSNGHSIGHWEGDDTLMIDTVGFLGFAGVPGGGRRGPNTHLVEQYKIVDSGEHLTVRFSWDDPAIYTKPHSYTLNYYKMPKDTYAFEDPCDSGNAKEYQSVNGISVIGATSVYRQDTPPAKSPPAPAAPVK